MIKLIELKNWKAFDYTKIDFLDGVNFLVGRNAVGKTSILEAICVAFTGEALTVDDPRILVRDNQPDPAEIAVEFVFEQNNYQNYRIERSLSKKQRVSSRVFFNKQLVVEGWEDTTRFLSKLLGIDRNFFERAVYMSESDILRFNSYLPKKAVVTQIEEALKIDKMTSLLNIINTQKDCYEKMDDEQRKELEIVKQIIPQQEIDIYGLKEKQVKAKKQVDQHNAELDNLKKLTYSKQERSERVDRAIKRIEQMKSDFSDSIDSSTFDLDFLQGIQGPIDLSIKQLKDITNASEPKTKEKGSLEEQIFSVNKIMDLFLYVEKEINRTSQCPVCGKPLYADEVKNLKGKFIAEKQSTEEKLSNLNCELLEMQKSSQKSRILLDKLNAAKAELEFIYADLNKDRLSLQSLCEIKNKLSSELDECQKTLSQKSIEVQQETKEMYDIEQRIELDARAKKFGGKEAIELNLVSTSKALIALDLLESAANETIEKQRKTGLEPIYKDITDVWNKMRGTQGSKIEVDGTMAPVLFRDGQKHELAQLSGGEKTALLTVIRTVLCRRFLQTGFMLLDEPLEHLDPENRRLIVDFLVESFEKRWVDQLIVTTFEESLLRKFLGNEKVNIIAI